MSTIQATRRVPGHARIVHARPAPAPPSRTPRARAVSALVLLALVAAAIGLRLALAQRSLWLDELITVTKARESLPALLDGLADDVHPPLYYVLLHVWMGVAGDGALTVRLPSVAWSAVCVLAVYAWSREAFPRAPAAPAAALVAVGPFGVWYGTEARMYAQLLALTALAGWLSWRLVARGPGPLRVAALGVVLVAMALTHYFAMLFVVALATLAVVLAWRRPAARPAAAWVLACCAAAVAALLPWLAFVAQHRSAVSPSPTRYPDPDVFSVMIAALEMLVGFQPPRVTAVLAALWPLLGLVAIAVLPRMGRVSWRAAGVATVGIVPAVLLVAASVLGPRSAFDPRFLAVCVIPLYLLVGRALPAVRSRRGAAVAVATMLAAAGVAFAQNHDAANPKLYEYAQAVDAINARAQPGDAVLLLPNYQAAGTMGQPVFDYYRLKPGLRTPVSYTIGQGSPSATHSSLRSLWLGLARDRPRRVFVIDAFSRNPQTAPTAGAARGFLAAHTAPAGVVPFAHATVRILRPDWRS